MTTKPKIIRKHRGIVIVVDSVTHPNGAVTYIARAGGRSPIGWECATAEVADARAQAEIADAYDFNRERLALWMNDSIHFLATKN